MSKTALPGLTGFRFYAALIVFLSHAPVIPGMERISGSALVFNAGVVAVSCFFVLSGFILTYNYDAVFRDGVSVANYRRFVWERWTKIYPVHLAMLLAALPIQILSPNLPLDWRAVPFHLLLVQCFWPIAHPSFSQYLNVPSWSVSCEWFFYLVAPMTMFAASTKCRRWLIVLVLSIYACGLGIFLARWQSDFGRLYMVSWFAPSRFPEFLTGVLMGRIFLADTPRKKADLSGHMQAAGIALLIAGAIYRAHAPWPLWGGLLYAPGAALLILGLAYGRGFFAAHLSRPFLKQLGAASFCLYMMQAPILRGLKGVFMWYGWEVGSWRVFWAVTIGTFLLTQSAAFMMHDLYELRLQRRLRRMRWTIAGFKRPATLHPLVRG